MQTENPAGRILYVTGNPNSNRLIILKEEKALYQKVDTNLNFVDREKKVEEFWKENHIFEKSMENRKEGPTYTFYDGPPTANGKPHIGHVLTRVIKDMIPRYRAMKGYMVPRKAGWDTHGLPVELEVEKKLGLDGKEQIEEYGMEPFIQQCKESVWKYKGMWEDFSSTVGFWADMEHPYVTYEDNYIESEWWALKEIWNKGLLYKGFKIVPYCPRCGTPLSSQEVSQGYKLVKERSAIARFKVVGEDAYFLAWTTTPWTLPSNVALCVNSFLTCSDNTICFLCLFIKCETLDISNCLGATFIMFGNNLFVCIPDWSFYRIARHNFHQGNWFLYIRIKRDNSKDSVQKFWNSMSVAANNNCIFTH